MTQAERNHSIHLFGIIATNVWILTWNIVLNIKVYMHHIFYAYNMKWKYKQQK